MFELFLLKKQPELVENDSIRKKFKLFLKTSYKKFFLKYKVNTFPSLCLASENAILGGSRRKN